MSSITPYHYRCSSCSKIIETDQVIYTCPDDHSNLDVILDYEWINQKIQPQQIIERRDYSIWRYRELLPVQKPEIPPNPLNKVGWTPVFTHPLLVRESGVENIWIKDESFNPTGSLKDRASAVVVAHAMQIKAEVVVTASTGNAGAALAGMSAGAGQKSVIFAPATAPPAKIAQLLVYGSKVLLVDGNYDDAYDLSIQCANEFGWYCRNTGYNPMTTEGKKTASFEIWEQLLVGDITHNPKHPLNIIVSVGDGNIISGLYKGFYDLKKLGWIDELPALIGVQSERSSAVANAFETGKDVIEPVRSTTIADSISVDLPRDGIRALRAVRETGGTYIKVSDREIISAIGSLGRAGVFAEPAGAAQYAGLLKAVRLGLIDKSATTIVLVTGSGLKDINSARQAVEDAVIIPPNIQAVREVLK